MRTLAIDCRSINKQKTGIGNVLINTLQRLKIDLCDITLFFDRELEKSEMEFFKKLGYKIEVIKCSNYIIWEQIIFPMRVKDRFEYVWFPANTGSIFIRAKKIVTIHDVIFAKSIKDIPFSGILKKDLARIYRRIFVRILAKTSIKIYTVSEFSKKDIIKTYKLKSDKVSIIYNGLDESFINYQSSNEKENYILAFGSNEPRKNTELMIYSYKELMNNYKDLENIKLILYGFRDYNISRVKKLISELNLNDNIIIYEYVSDEMLKKLYTKAKVFCFLSSFEGFGLPIIESMACKTPVIALDNSSISEIVNTSGILISKSCSKEISKEIYKILTDRKLYQEKVDLGLENIKKFRWDISIKKLSNDMNNIINSGA